MATVIGDASELGKINKALTDNEEEERKDTSSLKLEVVAAGIGKLGVSAAAIALSLIHISMDSEIKILWDTELKYRPGFSTASGIVNIPVIFSKFSGVKDRNTKEYWVTLKQLMTPETLVIDLSLIHI